MISRYSRPEMSKVWSDEAKWQSLLKVEKAVAKVQSQMRIIPKDAAAAIEKVKTLKVDRILEIEKTTRHDVIAFVSHVAEQVKNYGQYVHYGLTSSDVLDTALSLQTKEAAAVLDKSMEGLLGALKKKSKEHLGTWCSGRTHGMHAEPTTFGYKLAGYWAEVARAQERFHRAIEQFAVGKLSGAVGAYSALTPDFEKKVCKELGLQPEAVATQVIPRDRHAELIWSLAMLGAALERLSVELRHLQRTEVSEAQEGFQAGQKGSSAMPHKKNPISAENLTGCARLLRGYLSAAMEDIALWHERDISHSSVERVIFPDAFILAHYATERMRELISGLEVFKDRMESNMNLSMGQMWSSKVLLALVNKGLTREEAYKMVQSVSHKMKAGQKFSQELARNAEVKKLLNKTEIDKLFNNKEQLALLKKRATELFQRGE